MRGLPPKRDMNVPSLHQKCWRFFENASQNGTFMSRFLEIGQLGCGRKRSGREGGEGFSGQREFRGL